MVQLMRPRVVIVGAGVGGIFVANRLARAGGRLKVTVVNTYADHLNQPAFLYEALGSRMRYRAPAASLLRPGVELHIGRAHAIELSCRRIRLDDAGSIPFDYLVLATGSRLAEDHVPGFQEGAHHFHCGAAAARLSRALTAFEGGTIVVGASRLPYKCPPSPHEFVLLLEERLRVRGIRDRTRLVFVYPLPDVFSRPGVVQVLRPLFQERGIETVTSFISSRVEAGRRVLVAEDGREIPFELLVLVPPHRGAPLVRHSGLGNPDGWMPADPATLKFADRAYVLGDAADLAVPKSGAAAHYQADVVASNILAEVGSGVPSRYDGRVT
jgi:sulfide:quinone oxidoreductase